MRREQVRRECAVSSRTVRWSEGTFVSVGVSLSPGRLPMSMWTRKSFSLLSSDYNCLFGATLRGLRCCLSSLFGGTVYVLYKLGLCTCCLRHLIGAFWQEFYSFEFFFSCEGFGATVDVEVTRLLCRARHLYVGYLLPSEGETLRGQRGVDHLRAGSTYVFSGALLSHSHFIRCCFLHCRFEIMLVTNILQGLKFVRQWYEFLDTMFRESFHSFPLLERVQVTKIMLGSSLHFN
jgi:hypothetical protein